MQLKVNINPRLTAKDIQSELAASGTGVSISTIGWVLHGEGLNGRRPRKKPLLGKRHKDNRLKFAKQHLNDGYEFWSKVLWSDETKIKLFGHADSRYIWKKVWWGVVAKWLAVCTCRWSINRQTIIIQVQCCLMVVFCNPNAWWLTTVTNNNVNVWIHPHVTHTQTPVHSACSSARGEYSSLVTTKVQCCWSGLSSALWRQLRIVLAVQIITNSIINDQQKQTKHSRFTAQVLLLVI